LGAFRLIYGFFFIFAPGLVAPDLVPMQQVFNVIFEYGAHSIDDHRNYDLVAHCPVPIIAVIVVLTREKLIQNGELLSKVCVRQLNHESSIEESCKKNVVADLTEHLRVGVVANLFNQLYGNLRQENVQYNNEYGDTLRDSDHTPAHLRKLTTNRLFFLLTMAIENV